MQVTAVVQYWLGGPDPLNQWRVCYLQGLCRLVKKKKKISQIILLLLTWIYKRLYFACIFTQKFVTAKSTIVKLWLWMQNTQGRVQKGSSNLSIFSVVRGNQTTWWEQKYTVAQGLTSLNRIQVGDKAFLAPIILPELDLELLDSNICYQSWSWWFCALKFFIELELELTSSRRVFF